MAGCNVHVVLLSLNGVLESPKRKGVRRSIAEARHRQQDCVHITPASSMKRDEADEYHCATRVFGKSCSQENLVYASSIVCPVQSYTKRPATQASGFFLDSMFPQILRRQRVLKGEDASSTAIMDQSPVNRIG